MIQPYNVIMNRLIGFTTALPPVTSDLFLVKFSACLTHHIVEPRKTSCDDEWDGQAQTVPRNRT